MGRTINRYPKQFPTPPKGVAGKEFFTQASWKGLDRDKNFLTVDQETFADGLNVYVDDLGVLRSRPSLKHERPKQDSSVMLLKDDIVKKFYRFNEIIVYCVQHAGQGDIRLIFEEEIDGNISGKLDYQVNTGDSADRLSSPLMVRVNNDIYIFFNSSLMRYDIKQNIVVDAADRIYVPETTFSVNKQETKIEEDNILTSAKKIVYLYNKADGAPPELYGKEVTVEIDGQVYTLVFNEKTVELIAPSGFTMLGKHYTSFEVSNRETFLWYDAATSKVYYSADGQTISAVHDLPVISNFRMIDYPHFSNDGVYINITMMDERDKHLVLYIVSVLSDLPTGELRFPTWTDVNTYCDIIRLYDKKSIHHAQTRFETYNDFVCVYTQSSSGLILNSAYFAYRPDLGPTSIVQGIINMSRFVGTVSPEVAKLKYDSKFKFGTDEQQLQTYTGVIFIQYKKNEQYDYAIIPLGNQGGWEHIDLSKPVWYNIDTKIEDLVITPNFIRLVERESDRMLIYKTFEKSYTFEAEPPYTVTGINTSSKVFLNKSATKFIVNDKIFFISENIGYDIINLKHPSWFHNPLGFIENYYFIETELLTPVPDTVYPVYSNLYVGTLTFKYEVPGIYRHIKFSLIKELSNHFLVKDNVLYITDYREENGNFLWYIPKSNVHYFDSDIANIHPISDKIMTVFCMYDNVWNVFEEEQKYHVIKSKLELSPSGAYIVGTDSKYHIDPNDVGDVITTFDGQGTIFSSSRGIAILGYQNFVASTEQTITFLTDKIYDLVKDFIKKPVKLFKKDFWIVAYNNLGCFVFDTRTASWWPMDLTHPITQIFEVGEDTYIISGDKTWRIDTSYEKYYDLEYNYALGFKGNNTKKHEITWFLTSQKLHLMNLNQYKHVHSITFNTVLDKQNETLYLTPDETPVSFKLTITIYRKFKDINKTQVLEYEVETLRTFVQRLNYLKVNEFQYKLESNTSGLGIVGAFKQIPLSLTNLSIKYQYTGGVR